MATIYDTIKCWADGQNALNAAEPARGQALQCAVHQAVQRLRRQRSLADLAAAYYADEQWWPLLAREFELGPSDAEVARNAAYWQRFMQIRHPTRSRDAV